MNNLCKVVKVITQLTLIEIHYTRWCEADFMLHGWKNNSIDSWDSPFEEEVDLTTCGEGFEGWRWKTDKRMSIEEIRFCFHFYNTSNF